MKNTLRHILAVFSFIAAMSIASCQKETVQKPEETTDKQGTITPKKDNQEPADQYKEFTVDLPEGRDTTLYKGSELKINFSVATPCPEKIEASIIEAKDSDVSVSYNGKEQCGTITVPVNNDSGSFVLRITDGTTSKDYKTVFDTYVIRLVSNTAVNVPEEGGDVFVDFETNLPAEEISLGKEDWFEAGIENGRIVVRFASNSTPEDRTGRLVISDSKALLEPVSVEFSQSWILANKEGMVQFKDKAFKKAMLDLADTDGDGDVSFPEAEAVQEIDIKDRGVKDLTGLDAFKNAWKLDARNNDIEDASLTRELHYLHWLDLKGNKNLKTFDVTGCTIYFDHCEFELTDDLLYYCLRRQVGICGSDVLNSSDPKCEHSKHIRDERQTQDWSRQDRVVKIKEHTKDFYNSKGEKMELAVCFSGIGYIDVDLQDGSFDRLMRVCADLIQKNFPDMTENWEYLDIFYMEHILQNRYQFMFPEKDYNELYALDKQDLLAQEDRLMLIESYEKIHNNDNTGLKKLFLITIDIHCYTLSQGQQYCAAMPCYMPGNNKLPQCLSNMYDWKIVLNRCFDDDREYFYNEDASPEVLFSGKINGNTNASIQAFIASFKEQ